MTRPSRRPSHEPSRRAPIDKVVGGCVDLVRILTVVDQAISTGDAAYDFLMRRGFAVPSAMYAAVETNPSQRPISVVGVFNSAKDAQAYADAMGWPDFTVAPYRLHSPW